MKVQVHVASLEDVPAARQAAEANLEDGDELEIIVGQRLATSVETQPARQAVGFPPTTR